MLPWDWSAGQATREAWKRCETCSPTLRYKGLQTGMGGWVTGVRVSGHLGHDSPWLPPPPCDTASSGGFLTGPWSHPFFASQIASGHRCLLRRGAGACCFVWVRLGPTVLSSEAVAGAAGFVLAFNTSRIFLSLESKKPGPEGQRKPGVTRLGQGQALSTVEPRPASRTVRPRGSPWPRQQSSTDRLSGRPCP